MNCDGEMKMRERICAFRIGRGNREEGQKGKGAEKSRNNGR